MATGIQPAGHQLSVAGSVFWNRKGTAIAVCTATAKKRLQAKRLFTQLKHAY